MPMEKRKGKRVPANHEIIISSNSAIRFGTLLNCSEQGMYIRPMIPSPLSGFCEIHIPLSHEILNVAVRLVRTEKDGSLCCGIGCELLERHGRYMEFIADLVTSDLI